MVKKRIISKVASIFLLLVLLSVPVLQALTVVYVYAQGTINKPYNVTAMAGYSTTTLSWSPPQEGPAPIGYLIFRNEVQIGNVTTGTSYTDTGLAPGTSYTYKLQAYNNEDTSSAIIIPVATGNTAANQPPSISSVFPQDRDASYAAHSTIYFMSATSDSDGTVSTVKYYVNGALLGQSSDGKGIKSWYDVAKGDYSIAAVAVDNSGNTFTKVFDIRVGADGNILRQLYKDTYINTWTTGTSFQTNPSSIEKVKEGAYSLKVKNLAGNSLVNYRLISSAFNLNVSGNKDNVALQFWIYADTTADAFKQSFRVSLLSQNGSDTIECRLPLSSYLTANDYKQWTLVSIPFSDFYTNGAYYKGTNGTNSAVAADFNWSSFLGAGFTSSTIGLPETVFYLDDLKFIITQLPTPPPTPTPIPVNNLKTYEATVLPETYQTIKGWGTFPASSAQNFDFPHKYAAQKAIFKDLGITMFRQELRGTCGDADGNLVIGEIDNVVANIKTGVDNGIKQYTLHVWTPPAGMKNNNSISGKFPDGTAAALLQEKEEAFCQYIVKALDYIKSKGLPAPVAFSFQNEPDAVIEYQNCHYSLEQYKRVLILLRKTLDGAGYSNLPLLGAETGNYVDSKIYLGTDFSELTNNKEYADALGAFCSHSYTDKYAPSSDVQDYVNGLSKFPEKDRWMTEFCNEHFLAATNEIDRAIEAMKVFSSDIAWVGNNYWYWWMGWDQRYSAINGTNQQTLIDGDGAINVLKGKLYDTLATIFHNAPVGSKVKRLSTNDPAVSNAIAHQSDMVAFQNGDSTVVMLINTSTENKLFNVNGLTGSSAKVYSLSDYTGNMQQTGLRNVIEGTVKSVIIPARSINIIVTALKDDAPPAIQYTKENSIAFDGEKYISRSNKVMINGKTDEPATVKINGQTVATNTYYSFSKEVDLSAAMNTIQIDAVDKYNNSASPLILKIAYDPNYLGIDIDKTVTQVNKSDYVIKGTVNAASTIEINGNPVLAKDDLTFECNVQLSQGTNHFILTAKDGRGYTSRPVEFDVYCDSQAPEITIYNNQNTTEDSEFVISGKSSENLKSLNINRKDFKIRDDLSFIEKLTLTEGENTFIIQATDLMGNVSSKEYKITFNKTPITPHNTDAVSYTSKATGNITIDGSLDELDWRIDNKASKVISSKLISPNNIVNFGTLWDDSYLYVAARVIDQKLSFGSSNVWNNDCIELFLNPDNTKTGAYKGYDKQLFIGYTLNRNSMYVNSGAEYQTAWKDFDGGYSVEIKIPWSSLGLNPVNGLKLGFDISNDDKDISDNRENVIAWAGTADNYRDTKYFGTLILTNQKDVPYVEKSVVQDIDTKAPTTLIWVDKTENNGWFNTAVNITLSASDNMSGVAETVYRIGETGAWSVYKGPIFLGEDGVYNLQYYSTDRIGIVENIKQQTIQIDKSAPVTSTDVAGILLSNGAYNSDVILTVKAEDTLGGSGLNRIEYSFDTVNWLQYSVPITITNDGITRVSFRAFDNAGNMETAKSIDINIARTPDVLTSNLMKKIEGMNIQLGIKNSLSAKLNNTLESILKGDKTSSINKLNAFINEVNAQKGKKLDNELADELNALVNKIIIRINSETTL